MVFLTESLRVYNQSLDLAREVLRLIRYPPPETLALADQLRRSVVSISANIAEGNGRWHINDRKQFFWIARGSVFETVTHLQFAVAEGLISGEHYPGLKANLELIAKMITALIAAQQRSTANGENRQ